MAPNDLPADAIDPNDPNLRIHGRVFGRIFVSYLFGTVIGLCFTVFIVTEFPKVSFWLVFLATNALAILIPCFLYLLSPKWREALTKESKQ